MKIITFQSESKSKINQLVKVAKELGIETFKQYELTDEEMAIPGSQPSEEQLEKWLSKDDGEKYGIDVAFKMVKRELTIVRKRRKY